jgi:hypothetical protein
MPKFAITKLNVAIDSLLETTENPRRRFLLQAYNRHRYLAIAGRYEEIFAPDMMIMDPVYHLHAGGNDVVLRGQDQVKSLYRMWAKTNQSIVFIKGEEVEVADHYITSVAVSYQQVSGKVLKGHKADENDMYHYKPVEQIIRTYDDRGRLIGEDVWEPEPAKAELFKLDPAEVLTTEESAKLLAPLIKPIPSFDEVVLGKSQTAGR